MSKRKSYYAKAMAIINEEMPLLPIAHSKRFQARGIDVEGDILSNFGGISFYNAAKKAINNEANTIVQPEIADKASN